jgi:hypothetical protein
MVQPTAVRWEGRDHPFKAPEDYIGYRLCDPLDQRIGTVERLFVNGDGEPEYIRVRTGVFGSKAILIPVQMVAVDDERRTLVLR